MSHHINSDGKFQSDKYPMLPVDTFALSFTDPRAANVLSYAAACYKASDPELAEDITTRLNSVIRERQEEARRANEEADA